MPAGQSTAPLGAPVQSTAPFVAATKTPPARTDQDEFSFSEMENRGHFEITDRNLFEGQDLDVPTYLRKGIKIAT
jgi:cell division protein FtsZ